MSMAAERSRTLSEAELYQSGNESEGFVTEEEQESGNISEGFLTEVERQRSTSVGLRRRRGSGLHRI